MDVNGIIKGTCPNCGTGKIFEEKGSVLLFKVPKMHENCTNCGYTFEKEPGYFLGAMYVSYGLTVLEMLTLFFIAYSSVSLGVFFILIFVLMALLSFFNFRVARIIWIHVFYL